MGRIKQKMVLIGMVVIAFCLLIFAPIVSAGPIEDSVQISKDWLRAFHEGNADALSALYAQDAVYITWAGPFPTEGKNAIRATFAGFFRTFPTRFIAMRDETRRAYGDTVILNHNWSLVYFDAKGTMKTVYGRSSSVSAIVDGRRVIVDHNTSLLPIVGP